MIPRLLHSKCISLSKEYPVITITGPRQSGKTTLARMAFPDKPYINLEDPDQRQLAIDDPRGFMARYPDGAVFDEIQRAPQLPSYLQGIVDEKKSNGLYVLTGSQQFEISNTITQSLAGRTAIVNLLPLSLMELRGISKQDNYDEFILKGFYPKLYSEKVSIYNYYMNYFETYVQKDVRQLSQIDNLMLFEKFMHMIAGQIGQLLNLSSISNALGVSQPTIRKWVNILEASYIIFLLPPFYHNIKKRLIKTPKLYFYDTGLASYLLNIEDTQQLQQHPLRGNLFENTIVIEFLKKRFNAGKRSNLYFYRDRTGNEVDLVLEDALTLTPIEIKSSWTFHADFIKGITHFKNVVSVPLKDETVIYSGNESFVFKGVKINPWNSL
ncbi:MAG: ATP-binding protein [Spirochaetes bacterium]|nr:ATP-binding protein [Spirochaetota bacterium]